MKTQSVRLISLFLSVMLSGIAGCDNAPQCGKTSAGETAPASNRPAEKSSASRSSDSRSATGNTEKKASQASEKSEKESSMETAAEGKKKSTSASKSSGKDASRNAEFQTTGNSGRTQSGTGGRGSAGGSHRGNVPAGWISTDIKKCPSASELEVWSNILVSLEKLIVGQQVIFSPLGARGTSLTHLSDGKYKAAGRCAVAEKNGNQIAYEFECIARVNKYEASILTVNFHSQNN